MSTRPPALRPWHLSAAATAIWVVFAALGDHWARVADHWESAATMLFGSFLAGSSPEGGGAVAFPVFTKALDIPGPVARTFGLSIQAVGMSVAAGAIVVSRRAIHARAAVVGATAALAGFFVGLSVMADGEAVFWPTDVPTAWVKATFSIVLATTSVLMVRRLREAPNLPAMAWTRRHDAGLVIVGAAGGLLSSMTGTGANIVVFLFLVLLADLEAKVALPTAVIVMAVVSVAGLVLLGGFDGQLDITLDGDRVTQVGGVATTLPADRADLFGMWFAAVPVVVWGAPFGSWVASRIRESHLVAFVAVLAAVEVITTVVLVEELRRDGPLVVYLLTGLLVVPVAVGRLRSRRRELFEPRPSV